MLKKSPNLLSAEVMAQCLAKMKLNTKHKAKIRREVDLDLGVKPPRRIVFKSKKLYTRKIKHKK